MRRGQGWIPAFARMTDSASSFLPPAPSFLPFSVIPALLRHSCAGRNPSPRPMDSRFREDDGFSVVIPTPRAAIPASFIIPALLRHSCVACPRPDRGAGIHPRGRWISAFARMTINPDNHCHELTPPPQRRRGASAVHRHASAFFTAARPGRCAHIWRCRRHERQAAGRRAL